MKERCEICVHWSTQHNPDFETRGDLRRRCKRPRLVKETIEYRSPTDWCQDFQKRGEE